MFILFGAIVIAGITIPSYIAYRFTKEEFAKDYPDEIFFDWGSITEFATPLLTIEEVAEPQAVQGVSTYSEVTV